MCILNTHVLLLSDDVKGWSSIPDEGNAGNILNDPLFSSTTSTAASSDCVPLISCMRIRDIYLSVQYLLNLLFFSFEFLICFMQYILNKCCWTLIQQNTV